jgi:hypothetical protein
MNLKHRVGGALLAATMLMVTGQASARPMRFDLICHYVRASGHEVWIGFPYNPYRGPRVRTEHVAIDLVDMNERWLEHGLVPGPEPIPRLDKAEIRLNDTPYIKTIIRWSDGKFPRIAVQADNSLLIYKGRCKFWAFTPPGPPGQAYRGW